MNDLFFLLIFCCCCWIVFSGILGNLLLIAYQKGNKLGNRLLGFSILNLSLFIGLIGLTHVKNFYLYYPHTYRIGIFTQYLIAPLLYLFIKVILGDENKMTKWDWLHFIPAILHFIEFIPFYIMPTEEKIRYLHYGFSNIKILFKQGEGLLPPGYHPFIKITSGLVYGILQAELVVKKKNKVNRATWVWLLTLCIIYNLVYTCLTLMLLCFQIDPSDFSIFGLGSIQFYCIITLLFSPKVLDCKITKSCIEKDKVSTTGLTRKKNNSRKFILSKEQKKKYQEILETYITEQKPYLIKKYSISQLAKDTNIPTHHLSLLINEEYGCNYNDYINRHRINYFIENRYNKDWHIFSLEGLAYQSGFNSRNAFNISFKKFTNETPTTFFKKKDASELVLKCEKVRRRKFKNELTV